MSDAKTSVGDGVVDQAILQHVKPLDKITVEQVRQVGLTVWEEAMKEAVKVYRYHWTQGNVLSPNELNKLLKRLRGKK